MASVRSVAVARILASGNNKSYHDDDEVYQLTSLGRHRAQIAAHIKLTSAQTQGECLNKGLMLGLAAAILAIIAAVYFPVVHAGFVWDDWPSFRDLQGDRWSHYVFRDFNKWTMYFRPLVVAFLALQIKLFQAMPGPMHIVSLILHLTNVALVGALAHRSGVLANVPPTRGAGVALLSMLIYGLHPALIETVSWIGCQFDLIMTLLVLLGLLANACIERLVIRAAALALIFFFAANAKEAAAVFPMLVILFDAALFTENSERSIITIARSVLRRNWLAYVGMLAAGTAYLVIRHWALDTPGRPPMFGTVNWARQLQEICLVYLSYVKVILWPMAGIGPLHPRNALAFQTVTISSVLTCFAAVGIASSGFVLAVKRRSSVGFIILAVTICLLPVLHIVPVDIDQSLYHERYATLAIAVSSALLSTIPWPRAPVVQGLVARTVRLLLPIAVTLWLMSCVIDIRVLTPHWVNDIALWRWSVSIDPSSLRAKDYLLMAYEDSGDIEGAMAFGDQLIADPVICTSCMLHLAKIALNNHDIARAAAALDKAGRSRLIKSHDDAQQRYLSELGRLLNAQGRHVEAKVMLEKALALDPQDKDAKRELALANMSM